jgi:diguanylate cyclase (GGDEF)-like protein/PAS domain S-box-containing protein
MSQFVADSVAEPPTPAERLSVRAASTRHASVFTAYGQPMALVAGYVLVGVLWVSRDPAQVFHGVGLGTRLVLWLVAATALVAWQARIGRQLRRSPSDPHDDPRWERVLVFELSLFGLMWAAMPLFLLSENSTGKLTMLVTVICVANGALPTIAVNTRMFYAWVLPPMAALIGVYASHGNLLSAAAAALFGIELVFMATMQRDMQRQFAERLVALMRNQALVSQVQAADAALKQSLAEHELLFDLATVAIAEIRDLRVVRVNNHLETMLGYLPDALIGAPIAIVYPPGVSEPTPEEVNRTLVRGLTYECDMRVRRADNTLLWTRFSCRALDPAHLSRGAVAIFHDISDRYEREAAMRRLAHEDALTGLANRRLLDERARHALLRARRQGAQIALLLIDLDGFKKINDGHGHDVGDRVLVEIARRLVAHVRETDTVSRLGGDEFVVLLDAPTRPEDAIGVAAKLVAAASAPIVTGGRTVAVGASIGISIAPQGGDDVDTLLRTADQAMYRAKQSGRGTWRIATGESLAA